MYPYPDPKLYLTGKYYTIKTCLLFYAFYDCNKSMFRSVKRQREAASHNVVKTVDLDYLYFDPKTSDVNQ